MNQRARNARAILRQRRRTPWLIWSQVTTPNGTRARVRHSTTWRGRADYRVPGATVFGVYPPSPTVLRELSRYSR